MYVYTPTGPIRNSYIAGEVKKSKDSKNDNFQVVTDIMIDVGMSTCKLSFLLSLLFFTLWTLVISGMA